MLKSAPVSTADLSPELLKEMRMGSIEVLRDQCGYIVDSWLDRRIIKNTRSCGRYPKFYKITGRLGWHGGVVEDYTIPEENSRDP